MTLYLKYRPQLIDELDLQEVRTQLKNIVLSNNIPHAFLFSGPKGTGKTSAARILAKIINCKNLKDGEPCNKCDSCISITNGNNIDIIELDAASNRGIDDIRNLKENIYLSPVSSTKKVYIIDEAHMLTAEAANAFLKTLEEPPAHVVFILATTNPEKLPETVISRLTQINFTKATDKDIKRQMDRVVKGEEITIEDKAIETISHLADGSFRDAVKILENLSFKTKDIKESDLETLLPSHSKLVDDFFVNLSEKNAQKILEFIENLVVNGTSIKFFTLKIFERIHLSILAKNGIGEDHLNSFTLEEILFLNDLLSQIKNDTVIPQLQLEIALVKFCSEIKQTKVKEVEVIEEKQEVRTKKEIQSPAQKIDVKGDLNEEDWLKLLANIRDKNVKLEALLRAAKPMGYDGKSLKLGVYYQFHKERLEDMTNNKNLEDICKDSLGVDTIKVIYELIDRPDRIVNHNTSIESKPKEESLTPTGDKDIIDAAKEIFG